MTEPKVLTDEEIRECKEKCINEFAYAWGSEHVLNLLATLDRYKERADTIVSAEKLLLDKLDSANERVKALTEEVECYIKVHYQDRCRVDALEEGLRYIAKQECYCTDIMELEGYNEGRCSICEANKLLEGKK